MTRVSDEYIPTSRWSDEVKLAGWLCKHFKGFNPGKVMIAGSFYFKHCVWQQGIWLGSVSVCSTHRQGTSMVQVKISLKWPISYHTSNDKSKTYSLIYTTVLKIYFALFRLSHWELYFTLDLAVRHWWIDNDPQYKLISSWKHVIELAIETSIMLSCTLVFVLHSQAILTGNTAIDISSINTYLAH